MKYESELIKEIVDSRGHDKSSLHYESECIESWVEENKGAYPKLCDYQSEWLNYIKELNGGGSGGGEEPEPEEPPIGEFPYETVTTNHTATVNHVVPLAYKSAILKGQTLANRVSEQSFGGNTTIYEHRFYDKPFQQGETFTIFVVNPNVTVIKVGLHNSRTSMWLREEQYNVENNKRVVYTVPSGEYCCKYVGIVVRTANDAAGFENSLVIVSGDKSNLEIENYFEGMQSVQMPVLSTSNKYTFCNFEIVPNSVDKAVTETDKDTRSVTLTATNGWARIRYNVKHDDNVSYNLKFDYNTTKGFAIDFNGAIAGRTYIDAGTGSFSHDFIAIGNQIFHFAFPGGGSAEITNIEFGLSELKDEPFKSNTLTVNEGVTLRSNEDICDELDLLTGQLTQRIGEDGGVLTQEVIKTVDLTVVNQDEEPLSKIKPIEGTMHVTISGTPINPTAVLEVPVEAITQNLNSFIGEE